MELTQLDFRPLFPLGSRRRDEYGSEWVYCFYPYSEIQKFITRGQQIAGTTRYDSPVAEFTYTQHSRNDVLGDEFWGENDLWYQYKTHFGRLPGTNAFLVVQHDYTLKAWDVVGDRIFRRKDSLLGFVPCYPFRLLLRFEEIISNPVHASDYVKNIYLEQADFWNKLKQAGGFYCWVQLTGRFRMLIEKQARIRAIQQQYIDNLITTTSAEGYPLLFYPNAQMFFVAYANPTTPIPDNYISGLNVTWVANNFACPCFSRNTDQFSSGDLNVFCVIPHCRVVSAGYEKHGVLSSPVIQAPETEHLVYTAWVDFVAFDYIFLPRNCYHRTFDEAIWALGEGGTEN